MAPDEAGGRTASVDARRLGAVVAKAPAAIALLEGPEHRFALANPAYRDLVGWRDVVGLPIAEALPEVVGQGFAELLDRVYESGEAYVGSETRIVLADGDVGEREVFVDFSLVPTTGGEDGEVDGILVQAVDVTEVIESRRAVESLAQRLEVERRQLAAMIEQMPAGVVIAEVPSGRLVAANRRWREFFGVDVDTVDGVDDYGIFGARRPDGRLYEPREYPLARAIATGEVVSGEQLAIDRADGSTRMIEVNSAPVHGERGRVELGVSTFFDVTDARRTALLVEQNRALLELVAEGAPLPETLDRLVRMIEENSRPGLLASLLLLDRDGVHLRHGAGPSLPDAYNEAIDGLPIGEAAGSCGTAAFRAERVVVAEIETDPLWADYRELAAEHGLRACWSTPILASGGEVLGTFALYRRDPGEPAPDDLVLVEMATRTAAIAIERARLEEDRTQTLRVVDALHRVGQAVNVSTDLQEVVQLVTDAATELTGAQFGAFFYNVVRPDGESYRLYTLSGIEPAAFEGFPQPRNTAIWGPVFHGTASVRIDDVLADPRYGRNPPYHGLPEGHPSVRSYLAAPVKSADGEVFGGLFFGHALAGVFDEEAERLAVGIAAQAAVAIERARLFVRERQARTEAEARAQASLSLEHVDDGVCLVDGDGRVRVWNPAAESISGLPAHAVVGCRFDEAVPALAAAADGIEARGGTASLSVRFEQRDLWLSVSATRFAGGVVYTFRDRTEEHRLERMRSDIVATVSHELRTPLSAVYGAARTLSRPEVAGDETLRAQFLEMIVAETERLNRVVDQILAANEVGRRDDDAAAPVDLVALVRRVVRLAGLRSDGVAIELEAEQAPPVAADEDRLQQVVLNLVDNAVKYGGEGGRVVAAVRPHDGRVRLTVTDFGPGIPRNEAERIFERFYRLDPQQRRGVGGSGLGLYISRELIAGMGGSIWHEPNAAGRGSTFVVELPAA